MDNELLYFFSSSGCLFYWDFLLPRASGLSVASYTTWYTPCLCSYANKHKTGRHVMQCDVTWLGAGPDGPSLLIGWWFKGEKPGTGAGVTESVIWSSIKFTRGSGGPSTSSILMASLVEVWTSESTGADPLEEELYWWFRWKNGPNGGFSGGFVRLSHWVVGVSGFSPWINHNL